MKSLDQIRAAHAARFWSSEVGKAAGKFGGDAATHLPAVVAHSGLLPALTQAKAHGEAWAALMAEVGRFLSCAEVKVLPQIPPTLDAFLAVLTSERSDSLQLQRATSEALEYLGYLKRLATAVPPMGAARPSGAPSAPRAEPGR